MRLASGCPNSTTLTTSSHVTSSVTCFWHIYDRSTYFQITGAGNSHVRFVLITFNGYYLNKVKKSKQCYQEPSQHSPRDPPLSFPGKNLTATLGLTDPNASNTSRDPGKRTPRAMERTLAYEKHCQVFRI